MNLYQLLKSYNVTILDLLPQFRLNTLWSSYYTATIKTIFKRLKEWSLAWRSGSVMDCHATTRGSIPDGNGVKTKLHVLRKGQ